MIALDIFCLVVLGIFVLQGLWYGFLKGLFFITAWIAAAIGAYFGFDYLGSFFSDFFEVTKTTARITCIAIGFLVPFISLNILGRVLHGAVSKTAFSIPNRLLGLMLGVVKASILCSIVLTIVHVLPLTGSLEEGRNNSLSYALYLKELDFLGLDTKQPDIKGFVTDKADSAIDSLTSSAKETAKEALTNAANNATKEALKSINATSSSAKANTLKPEEVTNYLKAAP